MPDVNKSTEKPKPEKKPEKKKRREESMALRNMIHDCNRMHIKH